MTKTIFCRLFFVFTAIILSACSQQPLVKPSSDTNLVPQNTQLLQSQQEEELARILDVSIEVFGLQGTTGENSQVEKQIFSEIADIERQYLPVLLRNTLAKSRYWGAVSVVPKEDLAAELSVSGQVLQSDGNSLSLHIIAKDASGIIWLDKKYRALMQGGQQAIQKDKERNKEYSHFSQACLIQERPYQELYHQIANDLLSYRLSLSDKELLTIRRLAQIKHAQDLSPDAFNSLTEEQDGRLLIKRLLAHNDPILKQVERMRARHYMFIEAVDEHYLNLHQKMAAIYQLWQQYSCERAEELKLRELTQGSKKRRYKGGFSAMADNYRRYKISKMFEQEWQQLASSFKQEVDPAVIELNNRVYTLSGTVDQQLEEWRSILREFYKLQGLP